MEKYESIIKLSRQRCDEKRNRSEKTIGYEDLILRIEEERNGKKVKVSAYRYQYYSYKWKGYHNKNSGNKKARKGTVRIKISKERMFDDLNVHEHEMMMMMMMIAAGRSRINCYPL